MQQRIGIDVGGTNTDAVLMQGQEVVGWVKTPTTADVTSGIVTALQELLQQTAAAPDDIRGVMIGTTHFTNAVVQRRHLSPVAAVRLGLPATACVPALTDWPEDLRELVGQAAYMLPGGHEVDGRPIVPFEPQALERAAHDIKARGLLPALLPQLRDGAGRSGGARAHSPGGHVWRTEAALAALPLGGRRHP